MFFNFCVRGLSTRLEGREKEGKKKLKRLPSTLPLNLVPSHFVWNLIRSQINKWRDDFELISKDSNLGTACLKFWHPGVVFTKCMALQIRELLTCYDGRKSCAHDHCLPSRQSSPSLYRLPVSLVVNFILYIL